ncbi:MAG TPA: discoidin domain-containing protein [Cytophagaceae bacterium]|nr:discoidin domain-containing protein [Cytophagaceae bacterium]
MKYVFLYIALIMAASAQGQFVLQGNPTPAVNLGGGVYQLTPALTSQFGAIWNKIQFDLTKPFNVQGQMNFGADPGGADGMVFVLQTNCLSAGGGGGGIGYSGIPGNSLGVEFDTYQNIGAGTGVEQNNDPAYDHIAVEKNGDVVHSITGTPNPDDLFGPVQMDPVLTNVKTGSWYNFQISYNPATTLLQVYFNGSLRVSLVYDIKANLGHQYAYWGFTCTTGGKSNIQQISINSTLTTHAMGDTTICSGSIPVILPALTSLRGTNLAAGNPAVSLSNNGGSVATAVTDGNIGTRWESVWNVDPQWIYVDLQSPTDIDSVVLYWEAARASSYQLQTSTDAVTWTDVFSTTTAASCCSTPFSGGTKDKIVFSATNIRYVRMYGTARLIGYGYSIWEFQVYGQPKYLWSTNNGTNATISPDVYSSSVTLSPAITTTYSVLVPDPCLGFTTNSMTVTISCAAPVELISFTGKSENKGVQLQWATASEYNSNYFEVLKSSDGIHFNIIGYVNTSNKGNTLINYSYTDNDISSGNSYYKLVTVDFDGTRQESGVISVTNGNKKAFIPNPLFEDETTLILPKNIKSVEYSIVDMLGREFYKRSFTGSPDMIQIGNDLAPACYLVIVRTDLNSETIKVCKLR